MTKRSDGRWMEKVSFRVNGRTQTKYFYGSTKAEVNRKMLEWQQEQEKGVLFAEAATDWEADYRSRVAPNSLRGTIPAAKRAVEAFGAIRVGEITPSDINRFLCEFSAQNHASQKTVSTQLGAIRQILQVAVNKGYLSHNPANECRIPKNLPKTHRELPEDKAIGLIKENAVRSKYGCLLAFALYTGLRRGEILALDWSDIDLEQRVIYVSKSVYCIRNVPYVKQPKTEKSIRTVPILNALTNIITECRDKGIIPAAGIVFPNGDGGLISETQYQRLQEVYHKETGISVSAHQLRHAFATLLYEADIGVKDAQQLLGHAQASTTQDIYTHIRERHQSDVFDKLKSADF